MQSCCFGFEQHRGRWAVFSAAFHHAERAPRVTSSLTAESPTIRSFSTILGVDIRILTTRVRRARKTRKQIDCSPKSWNQKERYMFGRDRNAEAILELVFLCFAEPRGVGTCIGTS